MKYNDALSEAFRKTLTKISPELHAKVVYFFKEKKRLNWNEPQTFSEKIIKLKVEDYNNNPLVKQCADKYAVRAYVEDNGCGELLNELYAVYDSPDEIDWDSLPQSFALKLNIGCACNYFCPDKSKADRDEVMQLMRGWMKKKPWSGYAEMQYKVDKKILLEKYLSDKDGAVPVDYKVYCFHGEPAVVFYLCGRFSGEMHAGFFDTEWNYLGIGKEPVIPELDEDEIPEKPACLDVMLDASAKLSKNFPFVRIDFYQIDSKAVFGEMTFTPRGGFDVSECDINGKSMSEYLHI